MDGRCSSSATERHSQMTCPPHGSRSRDIADWWGPGPHHPAFDDRAPDGILVAQDDRLLLHRHADDRMVGNHGALTDAERLIPLLVAG